MSTEYYVVYDPAMDSTTAQQQFDDYYDKLRESLSPPSDVSPDQDQSVSTLHVPVFDEGSSPADLVTDGSPSPTVVPSSETAREPSFDVSTASFSCSTAGLRKRTEKEFAAAYKENTDSTDALFKGFP
uniref:J domain-containing protein n=1 Tax=Panagrellus redivivus TaxID=6233 RepID=A0A7E4VYY8_PANRE